MKVWNQVGSGKRAAVQSMFADIAPSYDRLNGLISLSLHRKWRTIAVQMLELHPGDTALDICCGTGDFMIPLRQAVTSKGRVFGSDFCEPMLQGAVAKGLQELSLGDACNLPFASECCDAVTVGWGIRNVPNADEAHFEIVRVLKPGGRFVSVDMARPHGLLLRAISGVLFNSIVPLLGTLFGKTDAYRYLPQSTQRFKTREQLDDSMMRAGFVNVTHRDLMMGNICIHYGRKPLPA